MQLSEGEEGGIPLNGLTLPHFCTCSKPYVMVFVVFNCLKWEQKILRCQNIERDKIDTHNKHIHDCSFSWLGRDTSIKSGSVKLGLWKKTSHEMIQSWKCFPHMSKMPTFTYIFLYNWANWVIFHFVNIGGIVDYHCLNFLFIIINFKTCLSNSSHYSP